MNFNWADSVSYKTIELDAVKSKISDIYHKIDILGKIPIFNESARFKDLKYLLFCFKDEYFTPN